MTDNSTLVARLRTRPLAISGAVFIVAIVLPALLYLFFLRDGYAPAFTGLRPAEASAIVAELDRRHIAYELADDGTTVLVPSREADRTRIAMAGSDATERGAVGFELFNKSDMGLTNFAQKINYQRALQGELARTILTMNGVDGVRVHLALPEHALFRADRSEPKAAITVTMKPGRTMGAAMVDGIRELVAAAIPDLSVRQVVVLDGAGRVVSPFATDGDALQISEETAAEQYYRARARNAVETALPGRTVSVHVIALPAEGESVEDIPTPAAAPAARNFRLRVELRTATSLTVDEQQIATAAIQSALALDSGHGDMLIFLLGTPAPDHASPMRDTGSSTAPMSPPSFEPPAITNWQGIIWGGVALLIMAMISVAAMRGRKSRPKLAEDEHEAFADRLRRQLAADEGVR